MGKLSDFSGMDIAQVTGRSVPAPFVGDSMSQTVLVVDDDPALRSVIAQILAHSGYGVLTADTFEAGQTALNERLPDLLIVDVRLGAFNGLQLLATATRPIPALVLTGYDDVTLKRAAHQFGAEYLVKPIAWDLLLAAVRRQLQSGQSSAIA